MESLWEFKPHLAAEFAPDFSQEFGLPKILGRILAQRGISNTRQAHSFLYPQLSNLIDPFVFPEMEKAVHRISRALENKERIMIFGDYDVDGISATSLLYLVLSHLGAEASYYLPHRLTEGYGLSQEGMEEAKRRGVSLIISTDCGMTAVQEANYARQLGIDLIISDHHLAGDLIPEACAIINPKFKIEEHPGGELAGVGVAFKIVHGWF